MAGPPSGTSPNAPPPNPPLWMPAGVPSPMSHRSMMPMMSLIFRLLGFTIIFLAALIVVSFTYPGGGCFPSPGSTTACGPGSTYITGGATAILTGHILMALGAFLLGTGAGMKIHWGLQAPTSGQKEDYRFVIADRWFNGVVVLVSIWILWTLLNLAPTPWSLGFP